MAPDHDVDIAYHEAGHAFFADRLGGQVLEVSLEPADDDDPQSGRTSVSWPRASRDEQQRRSALVALAGPLAELHFRGELDQLDTLSAWRADWREVQRALAGQRDPTQVLRRWLAEVRAALTEPAAWERVCRLADALEAHGTLDADLLDDLLPDAGRDDASDLAADDQAPGEDDD